MLLKKYYPTKLSIPQSLELMIADGSAKHWSTKIGSTTDVPMDVLSNNIMPSDVLRLSQYLTAAQQMILSFK